MAYSGTDVDKSTLNQRLNCSFYRILNSIVTFVNESESMHNVHY
jgi:hypothetical protein